MSFAGQWITCWFIVLSFVGSVLLKMFVNAEINLSVGERNSRVQLRQTSDKFSSAVF